MSKETLDLLTGTVLPWVKAVGGILIVIGTILLANTIRARFAGIRRNWQTGILPSVCYLLIHLYWWWMSSTTWFPFFLSNGFVVAQIVLVLGIYAATLDRRPSQVMGGILIVLGSWGLLYNGWPIARDKMWPPTTTDQAGSQGVAGDSNSSTTTEVKFATPPPFNFNYNGWKENLGFWLASGVEAPEVTEEIAQHMAAHCVAESGCNQYEPDGVTVRYNRENPNAICRMQVEIGAHAEVLKTLKESGKKFDPTTTEGCDNFSLALVRQNILQGKRFDIDWVTSEENTQKFLAWQKSQPSPPVVEVRNARRAGQPIDGGPATTTPTPTSPATTQQASSEPPAGSLLSLATPVATGDPITDCPADRSSMVDVTDLEKIEMPRGGTPTEWLICKSASCTLRPTGLMQYFLCGRSKYSNGRPGQAYPVGTVPFKILDGRGLFSNENASTQHVFIEKLGE